MKPLSLVDDLLVKLSLKKALPSGRPSEKSKLPSVRGNLCDADKAASKPVADQHTINSTADSLTSTSNGNTFSSLADSVASSSANIISNANSSHSAECYRLGDKEDLSVWRKDSNGNRQLENIRSQVKNHRAIASRSKCPSAGDLFENEPNTNKFSKSQRQTLTCILMVGFASFATMALIGPFFPKKATEMGLSDEKSGLTFSIYAVASVIFSPIMGRLVPLVGAKRIMLLGIFCNGLSNILFGLTEFITGTDFFFWSCLVLRILEAFGCISHITASYTFVIKKFPNDISYVFSLTESFIGAGLALGPAAGGIIYSLLGYGASFYIFGSFVLICLPVSWYFVEDIRDEPVDEVIEDSASSKGCMRFDSESGESSASKHVSFYRLLFKMEVIVNSLVLIATASANSYLFPTLQKHMEALNIINMEVVALEFFVSSAVYVISTLVIGRMLSEIKYQFGIMLIGICLTVASLLVIGPSELLPFLQAGLANISVGMVLLGLGCALGFVPTFESYYRSSIKIGLDDSIETYGNVAGLWSCVFSIGEAIGPMCGGVLIARFDFPEASSIMASGLVVLIPFLVVMVIKEIRSVHREKKAANSHALADPSERSYGSLESSTKKNQN